MSSRSSRTISVRKLYCNKRRAGPFFKWPANSYDLPPVEFFAFSEIKNDIEKMTKKEGECRTAASLACLLHDKAIKEGKSRKKRAGAKRQCYSPRRTARVEGQSRTAIGLRPDGPVLCADKAFDKFVERWKKFDKAFDKFG